MPYIKRYQGNKRKKNKQKKTNNGNTEEFTAIFL